MKYYDIHVNKDKWELDTKSTTEKSLQLFITNRCNLNCENCFASHLSEQEKKDMPLDDILELVKNNPEFKRINLMGGEPLLHKNINEIVEGINNLGRRVAIFTNGHGVQNLKTDNKVRLSVSFHEIESQNPSRKPLKLILSKLENAHNEGREVVLILLVDKYNYEKIAEMVEFVSTNIPWIKTLRIGLMRNEDDYFNDSAPGVISFQNFRDLVQNLLDTYSGRLSFEILTKGVLLFDNIVQDACSVDRFRNVFVDMTYSDCVLGSDKRFRKPVPENKTFLPSHNTCMVTGKAHCLIYKVRLKNKTTNKSKVNDLMDIVVTHKCSRKCAFCIDHYLGNNEFVSIKDVENALDFAKKNGITKISLTGGEPTLHPDIVEIAKLVKKQGFHCRLTTNYDFPEIIKQLDGIVDRFNISYYDQKDLPNQKDFKAKLVLKTILFEGRFKTVDDFDKFIEKYRDQFYNLKFYLLWDCNEWTKKHRDVSLLKKLSNLKPLNLTGDGIGWDYNGYEIIDYNNESGDILHYRCLANGEISTSWK